MLPLALDADWPLYAGLVLLTLLVGGVLWAIALLLRLLAERSDPAIVPSATQTLEAIEQHLVALRQAQGTGLDLRRVEHLLADIRESNKRLHEQWLALPQSSQPIEAASAHAWPLGERVIARLLALGFERIEILTPREEWDALEQSEGEVLVEARRSGASYKGRIPIHQGLIGEIHLKPSHTIFP